MEGGGGGTTPFSVPLASIISCKGREEEPNCLLISGRLQRQGPLLHTRVWLAPAPPLQRQPLKAGSSACWPSSRHTDTRKTVRTCQWQPPKGKAAGEGPAGSPGPGAQPTFRRACLTRAPSSPLNRRAPSARAAWPLPFPPSTLQPRRRAFASRVPPSVPSQPLPGCFAYRSARSRGSP